jgi:hypothetical protein
MIPIPPQRSSCHRHNSRWHSLSPAEKMKEFKELTTSPYWHFLPPEVKTRIQHLVTSSTPS